MDENYSICPMRWDIKICSHITSQHSVLWFVHTVIIIIVSHIQSVHKEKEYLVREYVHT